MSESEVSRETAFIHLRDNTTGEVRVVKDTYWSEFQWAENNYSCDCNRNLFFHRVTDPEYYHDDGYVCKDERYDVVKVILPDGTEHPTPEIFNWDPESRIKPPQN